MVTGVASKAIWRDKLTNPRARDQMGETAADSLHALISRPALADNAEAADLGSDSMSDTSTTQHPPRRLDRQRLHRRE